MKRRALLLLALVLVLVLAAAGWYWLENSGFTRQDYTSALLQFLESTPEATWRSTPEAKERRHENFTLGNARVFAALGATRETALDFTLLYGGRKSVRVADKRNPVLFQFSDAKGQALKQPRSVYSVRLRDSGIIKTVADYGEAQVTCLDFAPEGQEAFDAVQRVVLCKGLAGGQLVITPKSALDGRKISNKGASFESAGATLVLQADVPANYQATPKPSLAIKLPQQDPFAFTVSLIPAATGNEAAAEADKLESQAPSPLANLKQTLQTQAAWSNRPAYSFEKQAFGDWINGLLQLMRAHIGKDVLHTGALTYAHTRCWVRDDYWTQRALLEAGHREAAFSSAEGFARLAKTAGLASSYNTVRKLAQQLGYPRSEWPAYLVLMVKDLRDYGLQPSAELLAMAQQALDQLAFEAKGLSVLNTDETWAIASAVDEAEWQLDNTLLNWAALKAADELGLKLPAECKAEVTANWLRKAFLVPGLERFAYAAKGAPATGFYPDQRALTGPLARLVCLDFPATPEQQARTLEAAWQANWHQGRLREDARTRCVDDGAWGYLLYAAAETQAPFAEKLLEGLFAHAADTGNAWEYCDLYDKQWGGEHDRLWDSAVWLYGVLHYLFGITCTPDTVTLNPHFSSLAGTSQVKGFETPLGRLSLKVESRGWRAELESTEGTLVLEAATGVEAVLKPTGLRLQAQRWGLQGVAPFAVLDFTRQTITCAGSLPEVKVTLPSGATLELKADELASPSASGWQIKRVPFSQKPLQAAPAPLSIDWQALGLGPRGAGALYYSPGAEAFAREIALDLLIQTGRRVPVLPEASPAAKGLHFSLAAASGCRLRPASREALQVKVGGVPWLALQPLKYSLTSGLEPVGAGPTTWPKGWQALLKIAPAKGPLYLPFAIYAEKQGKLLLAPNKSLELGPQGRRLAIEASPAAQPVNVQTPGVAIQVKTTDEGLVELAIEAKADSPWPLELSWVMPQAVKLVDTRKADAWDRVAEPLCETPLANGAMRYDLKLVPGKPLAFGGHQQVRSLRLEFARFDVGPAESAFSTAEQAQQLAERL